MSCKVVVGNRKVAIVGAGYVGASIAYALALRDIAREIVLIDSNKEKAEGEAWDIRHGVSIIGTVDLYAGDYSDCADCDLIIITAGRNRRDGETRLDLIQDNVQILHEVIDSIKEHYTRGVILIISNPVDILTYKANEWMGLPEGMCFGSGCMLDSSRFVRNVADYVNLNIGVVNGYLIGEHGDSQIPIWSKLNIAGIPIDEYCEEMSLPWNEEIRKKIEQDTREMGGKIIHTKGRTHYGIATCVCCLADAVINMRPTIATVTSPMKGEYGIKGVALSVPSVIGSGGVQQKLREKWDIDEYKQFILAADKMRKVLENLE